MTQTWVAWSFAAALAAWTGWSAADRVLATERTGSVPWYVRPFNNLFDRYDSLHDAVPEGTVLGYASELAPGDYAFAERRFVLLYTLAPAVIDKSDDHHSVIADFSTENALDAYVKRSGGVLRAHPDLGLALIERPGRQP